MPPQQRSSDPSERRSGGGFLWGVAHLGRSAEGGYNQPGQARTNWAEAEERGDIAVSGRPILGGRPVLIAENGMGILAPSR